MANPQNEATVRRVLEFMNQPQFPTDYQQYFDPSFNGHAPVEVDSGPEGYRDIYTFWHRGFPDVHVTIEDLFSDGDHVGARWQIKGTHTGDFLGAPSTGKRAETTATGVFRCRNGKLLEAWVTADLGRMMQQLGIRQMPDMTQRRAA